MTRILLTIAAVLVVACGLVYAIATAAGVEPTVWTVVTGIIVVLGGLLYDPILNRKDDPNDYTGLPGI